jgi:Tfp pilus assembly protein PilV
MAFRYHTCCCAAGVTAEDIEAMRKQSREVTLGTFRRHCRDLISWEAHNGYDTLDDRGGLRLKNDWHVAYYRSVYQGKRCYYLVHSAIEYIWLEEA